MTASTNKNLIISYEIIEVKKNKYFPTAVLTKPKVDAQCFLRIF